MEGKEKEEKTGCINESMKIERLRGSEISEIERFFRERD